MIRLRPTLWALLLCGSALLTGCGASVQVKPGTFVRFANLSPDAKAMTVYYNGNRIGHLRPDGGGDLPAAGASREIEFGNTTAITFAGLDPAGAYYFKLGPLSYGVAHFQVRLFGKVTPATGEPGLTADRLLVDDTLTAGKAGIRVVHAAPGLGTVNILWQISYNNTVDTSTAVTGLAYRATSGMQGQVSKPVELDPGSGDLIATLAATGEVLARRSTTLTAAQTANFAVVGDASTVGLAQW